jgi:hypothetical protein
MSPCQITNVSLEGLDSNLQPFNPNIGGYPTYIRVSGKITGCPGPVNVGTSCTPGANGILVDALGNWSTNLLNMERCECVQENGIYVRVECAGADCIADPTCCFEARLGLICGGVTSCPTASNASWADKGCIAVVGQGKKRQIELSVTVAPTGMNANAQWILRKKQASGTLGPPINGPTFGIPAGTSSVGPKQQIPPGPQIVELDPGDYEASLKFLYPYENCPGIQPPLDFTLDACPQDCPTLTLAKPIVTGCAPTNAVVTFNATLGWQSGQVQVPVDYYLWTVEWEDKSVSPPIKKGEHSTLGPTLTPSIKSNDLGWTGNGTVGGRLDLSKPGNYTASVQAIINGVSPTIGCNAFQSSVPPFFVPGCDCPKPLSSGTEWTVTNTSTPLGSNQFQTLDCDSAATQLTLYVDPGSYSLGDLIYDWKFPGTNINDGGVTQAFTFKNDQLGIAQTHKVTVTVRVQDSKCTFDRTVEVTVPGCGVRPVRPPTVSGCSVSAGNPGTITITFSKDVDQAAATNPSNFTVLVNGTLQNLSASQFSYSPNATTISGVNVPPGAKVDVTVTNVPDKAGNVIAGNNTTSCISTCPSGQHWDAAQGKCVPDDSDGGCSILCSLSGFVLIAIPISAYISTVAHCIVFGWNIALQGGIIALAIGAYIALCGICCLWRFLLLGAAMGIIATIIYAYWGGFPNCWSTALPILIGYVGMGIGMAIACTRPK